LQRWLDGRAKKEKAAVTNNLGFAPQRTNDEPARSVVS
jgi:hypothetical protein